MLKIKTLRRSEWKRITQREQRLCCVEDVWGRGMAALLTVRALTAPLYVEYPLYGRTKIADVGYQWLQIAPEGCHWWLTVMYDAQGALVQSYFDMTRENDFSNPDDPSFTDLFLDVVIPADGAPYVLDQDELQAALDAGEITRAEYDMAQAAAEEIINAYRGHEAAYRAYLAALRQRLLAQPVREND